MSNKKYYDYYQFDGSHLASHYKENIEGKRNEIIQKLLSDTGATAYRSNSRGICDLVYPREHEIAKLPHIKLVTQSYFEDKPVICVTGKGNTRDGRAFRKLIESTNDQLRDLPDFKAWAINTLGVHASGIGGPHPNGRGSSLLSTDFAMRDGVMFLMIPNSNCEGLHKCAAIPDGFKKMTYGEFYDATN